MNKNQELTKSRINNLIKALSNGIYEREHTIRLCLLAALSGESVFLLGPPGIAKSLIAKRLIQAFDNASFFDYLMTSFSTPEEVFGPLSIKELKENSNYIRLTKGYLPTADIVFLDEIWKAGPAILNTLLTVINERTFKNGQHISPIPMRLLITASNETPAKNSGLDALYDRMLVRINIDRIKEKKNFQAMLMSKNTLSEIPASLTISNEEFFNWQEHINDVQLNQSVFDLIYVLKNKIENMDETSDYNNEHLYISDRRWKKSIRLLKACAFFNGKNEISPLDLLILTDCIWDTPNSRHSVQKIIEDFAAKDAFGQLQIQNNIDNILEKSNLIRQEMVTHLSEKMILSSGRLKDKYQLNVENCKDYSMNNKPMVKLVLLEINQSVSDIHNGDSEYVYINSDELNKAIRNGKGEIYGYINRQPKICPLMFEIDAKNNLIIKDTSNRSIHVCLAKKDTKQLSKLQNWQHSASLLEQELRQTQQLIKTANAQFHSNLPHNFIEKSLILHTDASFITLSKNIEQLEIDMHNNTQRILNINSDFQC
ncbi:ATPase RavA domain-containing protein [Psychromonas sp. CNPT3]|uniref:ATPase RavA domain-containing protein n=1 Tax=Psychromonas sp. CNPT3 TaxID=314282 RepID=UPI000325F4AF|nr:ATPase RavA domain-containing protein [Psychromonas sp. CNPT3]